MVAALVGALWGAVDGYILSKPVSEIRFGYKSYYYPRGLRIEHWIGVEGANLGADYLPVSDQTRAYWARWIARVDSDEHIEEANEMLVNEITSNSAVGAELNELISVGESDCWQGVGMDTGGCRGNKVEFVGVWLVVFSFATLFLYPIIWIVCSSFRFVFSKRSDEN